MWDSDREINRKREHYWESSERERTSEGLSLEQIQSRMRCASSYWNGHSKLSGSNAYIYVSNLMNIEGEVDEEIRAKSRGIIGKRKGVVKMAAELVVVVGDAKWAGGIDESVAILG